MEFKDCFEMKVDFMDMNTGVIYCIQEYWRLKDLGLPMKEEIEVREAMSGELLGYVDLNDIKGLLN